MGLINDEDVKSNYYEGSPYTADYEFAAEKRLVVLKKAFLNITDSIATDIKNFEIENPWLTDYAVFMAVKLLYGSPTFSHGLPSFFLCVDSYSDNYPVENFQPAVYDGLVPDGEGVE